jgi:epoxyqueuosine reductase
VTRRDEIRHEALALGFDAVGFAAADLGPDAKNHLTQYLALGYHGDMGWLESRAAERSTPKSLWPEARSVVVLGLNYGPAGDPLAPLARRDRGTVSVYAQGRDYHDLVKKRLKALARFMTERFGCALKVFVDTAPVMEKPLAERAGLGWQGKHTNLVSREFGSWLFLGEIYCDLELAPDPQETDREGVDLCGSCQRCLDVCPTDAFPAPYRLDARRCISYLTIEHKGHIPREFRAAMGNRVPSGHGQPHLRLRRLPGRLPLEQVRPARGRSRSAAPRRTHRTSPGRPGGARRCRLPPGLRRLAHQAHRPRQISAQRADRHRQQRPA